MNSAQSIGTHHLVTDSGSELRQVVVKCRHVKAEALAEESILLLRQ